MSNEITNQMKIENLTAKQANVLCILIKKSAESLEYAMNKRKMNREGEVAWANDFIEYHYDVKEFSYRSGEYISTEIKVYDWVIDAKEQIAEISEIYFYENDELRYTKK